MMTFPDLLSGFLQYSVAKASYGTYCRLCDQYFFGWSDHPTYLQIEDWHKSLLRAPLDERGQSQKTRAHHANKGLSLLKAMYTWAMRRELHPGPNPATGVKRHQTFSRERVMTCEEVGRLVSCLDMMPAKVSTILLVLLLTGCRLSEAREMQRQHVDLLTGRWFQPKTKNGKPHVTYLPRQAREAIARLKPCGDFVFGGVYDHCWSRAGVEKTWRQVREALGLKDVRLHDFRRTLSTHLYRATKDEYLVKRCINHVNPSVTAIYVRITYDEVASALQAQADRFSALTTAQEPALSWTRRASDRQEVVQV